MEPKMTHKKKHSVSKVLKGHEDTVWSVAVTPDGKRAVSGAADRTLKVWNLVSGKGTATFKGHEEKKFQTIDISEYIVYYVFMEEIEELFVNYYIKIKGINNGRNNYLAPSF